MCFAVGESSSFISLGSASSVGFVPFSGELSFTLLQVASSSLVVVNAPSCSSLFCVSYIFLFFE